MKYPILFELDFTAAIDYNVFGVLVLDVSPPATGAWIDTQN